MVVGIDAAGVEDYTVTDAEVSTIKIGSVNVVIADSVAVGKDIPSGVVDRHRTDIGGIIDYAVTRTVEFGFERGHNHLAGLLYRCVESETAMPTRVTTRVETDSKHTGCIGGRDKNLTIDLVPRAVVDFCPYLAGGIRTIINVKGIATIDIKFREYKTEPECGTGASALHSNGVVARRVYSVYTTIITEAHSSRSLRWVIDKYTSIIISIKGIESRLSLQRKRCQQTRNQCKNKLFHGANELLV